MKPLKLELQAFGPFVEKQTVDFPKLSEKGMFLIKGSTGSGKTTIFDAITVALYGESTGEVYLSNSSGKGKGGRIGRNDLEEWRCTQAPPDMTTYVSFEFESGGHRYVFKRGLIPKKVNLATLYEGGEIDEDGNVIPFFNKTTKDSLTAKAEELIGLTKDQFRQVVFLPQGQFERFLIAPSDEKEGILKKIFGTERWSLYADRFFAEAKSRKDALDDEKKEIDASLRDSGASSIEDLDKMIIDLGLEKERLEEDHVSFDGGGKQDALNRDMQLAERFRPLHELERTKEALAAQKAEADAAREAHARAENAESLRALIAGHEKAANDLERRENDLKDSEAALPAAEEKVRRARKDKATHDNDSPVEKLQKKIGEYETKRPFYEKYGELEAAFRKAEAEKITASKAADEAEANKTKAAEKAEKAGKSFEAADREAADYRKRYRRGIYGEIAEELEEDKACPVCGSKTHPAPAAKIPGSVSKEDVDLKEEQRESAKRSWDSDEAARIRAIEELENKRKALEEKITAFADARSGFEAASVNLIEGVDDADALDRRIKQFRSEISEYESRSIELDGLLSDAIKDHTTLEQSIKQEREERDAAKEALDAASDVLFAALREKGYADVKEAKAALKSDEERRSLHASVVEYDTQCRDNANALAAKRKELEHETEPDASAFEERQRAITSEQNEFSQKHSVICKTIEELSEKKERLAKKYDHYLSRIGEAEADLSFAKTLRGDSSIGLQRYVLAVMFEQVIGYANEMLASVHGGRYRLCRTDERGSKNKRGLELKVRDSRSPDKDRKVSMLSGGEKFLVSLALSIGMSTVAQKTGVRIEALFIDEGFGTLDDESIADAMMILESVRKSSGMIGIISHVQLLEGVIPIHLEVAKTDKGSYVELK